MWSNIQKTRKEREAELNRIMTDEYNLALDMGRKLNIMDYCRKAMNKAIERFNFDLVIEFMTKVNWKWANGISPNDESVPNRERFIKLFNEFFDDAIFEIIKNNRTSFCVSSGGVVFEMYCRDLEIPSEDNIFCNIYFDIATCSSHFHFEN